MSPGGVEIEAQFGPQGPIAVADAWIQHVLNHHFDAAWKLTSENFRREMAADWLDANAQHPNVASERRALALAALVGGDHEHRLWPPFAAIKLAGFQQGLRGVDLSRSGWASKPRVIAPGRELVLLVPGHPEFVVHEEDTPVRALGFVMEHSSESGWLLAGLDDPLAHP